MSTEELQNDDNLEPDNEIEVEEELHQEEVPSDLAPDSDDNHEESVSDDVDDGEINQEAVNEAIAKQHAKYREEERKRLAGEKELAELKARQQESSRPIIPPVPDPYQYDSDTEYQEAVRKRDEALRASVEWEQSSQQAQQQSDYVSKEQANAQQVELQQTVTAYAERSHKLGIKPEELQAAGQAVHQMGISDEVSMRILKDERGPLITRYLAKNPMETIEISQMNPIDAVLYIERNIRPKLGVAKKVTKTPPPPSNKGNTTPVDRSKFPLTEGRVKFK